MVSQSPMSVLILRSGNSGRVYAPAETPLKVVATMEPCRASPHMFATGAPNAEKAGSTISSGQVGPSTKSSADLRTIDLTTPCRPTTPHGSSATTVRPRPMIGCANTLAQVPPVDTDRRVYFAAHL
jgi:hypothetical protein